MPLDKKRAFAAMASLVIPGVGQLALGRGKQASLFLSASVIVFFVLWVVPLPETFAGLILGKLICGLIGIAALIDAWLLPWQGLLSINVLLVLAFIPIGLFIGTIPASLANLHHGFRAFQVTNTAMEPTLHMRDRFVTEFPNAKNAVKRGDVVAFSHHGVLTIKRVIGIAGDTIEGRGEKVFWNGQLLEESYVQHIGGPSTQLSHFGPVTVPPMAMFLLGDNRDVSYDSRFAAFGLVSASEIVGKALYIYYSPNRHRFGEMVR